MINIREKDFSKRTQKDYSLSFKLQIVDEIEKGYLTYKQSQKSMEFREEVQFCNG
ncbi:MAG: hypothetical protein IPJ81_09325 [Chitinophagaceae bacterium]|nr:hypothetical protein [Chitinophagaceae bacterium]